MSYFHSASASRLCLSTRADASGLKIEKLREVKQRTLHKVSHDEIPVCRESEEEDWQGTLGHLRSSSSIFSNEIAQNSVKNSVV